MIDVPAHFRLHHPFPYPPDNVKIFEEWLFEQPVIKSSREYLPVFWTSYLVKADFGTNRWMIDQLQQYVNSLDKTKKYWTVIQYDSGPVVDISHLDCIVIAMSGNRIDYPIPLLCLPHQDIHIAGKRKYKASFIGQNTHVMRKKIAEVLRNKPDILVSSKVISLSHYCRIIRDSVFTLCPRGFGQSSFRIAEAIQYGSIPIYISDDHVIPYNEDFDYGLIVKDYDIPRLYEIINSVTEQQIIELQEKVKSHAYKFTYDGCRSKIQDYLSTISDNSFQGSPTALVCPDVSFAPVSPGVTIRDTGNRAGRQKSLQQRVIA